MIWISDYAIYAIAFVAGLLVKFVDWIEDEKGGKQQIKYPLALIYGAAIGYLISAPAISELFLGALLAQIFARKIDTLAHMVGFLVAIVVAGTIGLPTQNLSFLFLFFALAVLDELPGWRAPGLGDYRLALPMGALIAGLIFARWEYLAGIALFDLGYVSFKKVVGWQKRKRRASLKTKG